MHTTKSVCQTYKIDFFSSSDRCKIDWKTAKTQQLIFIRPPQKTVQQSFNMKNKCIPNILMKTLPKTRVLCFPKVQFDVRFGVVRFYSQPPILVDMSLGQGIFCHDEKPNRLNPIFFHSEAQCERRRTVSFTLFQSSQQQSYR